jgi:hypothetical protein
MRLWMAGLALFACASAAPAQLISTSEPTAVAAFAKVLGLKPSLAQSNGSTTHYRFTMNDVPAGMSFAACTDDCGCQYLVLVSTFDDVLNPSSEWGNA